MTWLPYIYLNLLGVWGSEESLNTGPRLSHEQPAPPCKPQWRSLSMGGSSTPGRACWGPLRMLYGLAARRGHYLEDELIPAAMLPDPSSGRLLFSRSREEGSGDMDFPH